MEGDVISQEAKSNTLDGFDYQDRNTRQTKGICTADGMLCLEASRAFTACDKQLRQNFKVKQLRVRASHGVVIYFWLVSHRQKVGYQGLSKDVCFPPL